MKNRFLALLLALCLLIPIPAGALAEEMAIDAEQAETDAQEAGSIDLTYDGEEAPPEEALPEVSQEEVLSKALTDHPEITEGFAAILNGVNLLYNDDLYTVAENLAPDTVLYVVERSADGQAKVACAMGDVVLNLWIDAASLRQMEAEEISAYLQAAKLDPNALWLNESVPVTRVADKAPAVDPDTLAVNPGKASLKPGETLALTAEGVAEAVTWSSENEAVATVSAEGLVTAVAPGRVRIVAATADGRHGGCAVTVNALAKNIHFQVAELSLGLKESSAILTTLLDELEEVSTGSVTYQTSDKKIVTVSEAGVVKALKRGEAVITATNAEGLIATCNITVLKAPTKVTVSSTTLTLGEGQSYPLEYKLPVGCAGAVKWSSSKPAVASVDPDTGVVTALSGGSARIYATAFNKKKGTVKLTVKKAPKTLAFAQDSISIGAGQAVTAFTDTGNPGEITYVSEAPEIVEVSGGALVGVAEGVAHVRAETYNGLTAECDITVKPAPPYVRLDVSEVTLGVKDTLQLYPDSDGFTDVYSYVSSKPKVVKVSDTGLLTGLKAGTSYVTISTYNNKSFRLKVTVLKAPGSVTASPKTYSMGVGDQFTLSYTLPKKTGGTATFESEDESVVTVDSKTGLVTAVGAGKARVTVCTFNNRVDYCTVTVYGAPGEITLNSNLIDLAEGETFQLEVTMPEGSLSDITYESENPAVATVSESGLITGVGYGTTSIYARTNVPEVFAAATVTSWDAPASIKLDASTVTKNVDEVYTLKPTIPENSHTTFTFVSSNPKVAEVNEDGVVTPLSKGQTVITVLTHNGLKAVQNLTVDDPWYPESIKLTAEPPMLKIGQTYLVQYALTPATAKAGLVWTSSDKSVATVDETGLVKAVGMGTATILATSPRNEKLMLSVLISVETEALVTTIPKRVVYNVSEIDENLAKIDAIRKCANSQIDQLAARGEISSSDASKRHSMVNNIFANYAFPWKTLKFQEYWKAANSENGAKDFKTDRVYFGLPYISGSGSNRHYDVALALSENRYYDSGEGYYILNQNRLVGGKYVGNDCSGLVNVSIWGTSSSRASDRTDDIASSKYYTTISDWTAMRPGDLICKSSAHVIMFLYYVNTEKTKIMMIENGGAEAGTNTVHCDIYDLSYYKERKYHVRRLATLG